MREELIKKCKMYVHQVWCMMDLAEGGVGAVYGLEQYRLRLHDEICELLNIDRIKSKTVLSYLDESIGLDLENRPDDEDIEKYGVKLADLLISKQEQLR